MSYVKYGIDRELVERVKRKMKQPATKEKVKAVLEGVTKRDLQNERTVRMLLKKLLHVTQERVSDAQADRIVGFVLDQKIDPNNTFHLLKLWGMFR